MHACVCTHVQVLPPGDPSFPTFPTPLLLRFALAEATVARASDFGRNDTTFFVRTHLGHVLHPGEGRALCVCVCVCACVRACVRAVDVW